MDQTPFHAYYTARILDALPDEERFIPVFASSDIKVYPFQIAASSFALRSPYQKGVVLCDEAGMGKTHESLLVVAQQWLEGKEKIAIAVPNADLLHQWTDVLQTHYTLPFVIITNSEEWRQRSDAENDNAFLQEALVLTTYDFLASHQTYAKDAHFDIIVYEEASLLSAVCSEGSRQAKILKEISENAFKILLTGTPIEKNIMDLYGLIYFIDEDVLPDKETYMHRYLRKPENYPELAARVSRYCFRTLRSQASRYARIPKRILITLEYKPSAQEQKLYDLLCAYINRPEKYAFPKMEAYDLSLRLLGLLGSSTAAILRTLYGVAKRLENATHALEEYYELQQMIFVAENIETDAKAKLLIKLLGKVMPILKKLGANRKAVIFTESVETQKMLCGLLKEKYDTSVYNGSADYSAIQHFKDCGEILLSTDNGARGFDLQAAAFVINYDLLYNTLKMEQRIDRCHRLEQENDVLAVAFINSGNFADVRKLELVNKRFILSDGVFGVSDPVLGGFTSDLNAAISDFAAQARTRAQVQNDYRTTLDENETENRQIISNAEDVLYTTFTRELAAKVRITPQYAAIRAKEINAQLWELVKYYFQQYNEKNTDCYYEIDEENQTITATRYTQLPHLFYYWTNSGNKRYQSLPKYGMASDFKPHTGRITLTSPLVRGILHAYECANEGSITVDANIAPCQIALYTVKISPSQREYVLLAGETDSGISLTDAECRQILSLPVLAYTEQGRKAPAWLKSAGGYSKLDNRIDTDELLEKEKAQLSPLQKEKIEDMKLQTARKKSVLKHNLDNLDRRLKALRGRLNETEDRLEKLKLQKQINTLYKEYLQKQESQYFDEMQLDMQLEKKIEAFYAKQICKAQVIRSFDLRVEGR